MSSQLKFGNQVVFLNGNPIGLPTAASDPGSPVIGYEYYNTSLLTVRTYNGSAWVSSGSGTVTSVAFADGSTSPIYSVSGSPVTTSGALTITLSTQSANTVFAGPTSGGAAQPTFRSLVASDIPSLAYANQALSNLASVAINTALLPGTTNTLDFGSASKDWVNLWASTLNSVSGDVSVTSSASNGNVKLIANGTGNLISQATVSQISQAAGQTNYKEIQYFDSESLAANTSSFTTISDFTIATANFRGMFIEYTIREATTGNQRTGQMKISTDGTLVGFSDEFVETAVLGSAAGLQFQAVISGGNLNVQYNNTSTSNACTMRATATRYRA